MNADAKLKQLQDTLAEEFRKRMEATPQDASLETWHQSRALAYAYENGRLTYELGKALRDIDALQAAATRLQSKLDGTAGYADFDLTETQPTTATLNGAPCLVERSEYGSVVCVYIAGQWVEPEFFSAKAHEAWAKQRQAAAQAIAEEVAA